MTRCDPPHDGSGVLIDHHTGLKLVTQPRKEPPRALRHPRLVAATTHNCEHPSHHCSQERANPSKGNTYSRCPHDVTMPDFCSDKATSWSSSSEVKHPQGDRKLALRPGCIGAKVRRAKKVTAGGEP